MHSKYGLKRSVALRLSKILAFLFFLIFLISFTFMFVDEDAIKDFIASKNLTEDRKEELLANDSFKLAVRLAYEVAENPDKYGEGFGIKTITHLKHISHKTDARVFL